jgi:Post-segregation antitoxin CcdA
MARSSSAKRVGKRRGQRPLPQALDNQAPAAEPSMSARAAREANWRVENRAAIEEYNARVETGFFDEFLQRF